VAPGRRNADSGRDLLLGFAHGCLNPPHDYRRNALPGLVKLP
jgi:hypothetical protein